MTRIGVVCPLPPCPSGPAEWVADTAALLSSRADVVFFVDDPAAVRGDLLTLLDVRPVAERFDPSIDVLIYHLANNPHHTFVYRAAIEGPAGLCEVHDASIHHLVQHLHGTDEDAGRYGDVGLASHGEAGRDAVNMRRAFARGQLDMFLFDLLAHVLRMHRGAIVHSDYAARVVQLEAPDVTSWLARLHAPTLDERCDKQGAGLPADRFVVGTFGFIAPIKRPLLLLEAFRCAVENGLDGHLLFAGKDETDGELIAAITASGVEDRVTVTGFLDGQRFEQLISAVDATVSLRAPHAGETSATLAYALAAGRPTLVQDIGSWAELPDDVVVKVPVGDDEASALAEAMQRLGADPSLRAELSRSAELYATKVLTSDAYCDAVLAAVDACEHLSPVASRVQPSAIGARTDARSRPWRAVLEGLPAQPRRVLAVDCPAWVAAATTGQGHEVTRVRATNVTAVSPSTVDVVIAAAGPPSRERRSALASFNRVLGSGGEVHLSLRRAEDGGEALVADLATAGLSVRSPRFDLPPADLWPPPRGSGVPPTDHIVARKCGLPSAP